jgi:hypothetical protein
MPLFVKTTISPLNRGIRSLLTALISTEQIQRRVTCVPIGVPLLFFVATSSSCSFYLVISPLASLFFCFSYNYFFSFTFPVFISFNRLSSTSHVSSALPFVSFYFYLRCLPPHSPVPPLLLSSCYDSFTPFIVLKLPPVPSYSYSSSHLLISPPPKSCPALSASH